MFSLFCTGLPEGVGTDFQQSLGDHDHAVTHPHKNNLERLINLTKYSFFCTVGASQSTCRELMLAQGQHVKKKKSQARIWTKNSFANCSTLDPNYVEKCEIKICQII